MGHSVREVIAKLMVTERGGWEDDAGGRGGAGLTDRADDNVTTGPQVTLLVTHSVSLGREFLCAANTYNNHGVSYTKHLWKSQGKQENHQGLP